MAEKRDDLKVEHIRGSGPGGQHRNKRQTGVRIEHVPTGVVVVATERRSQTQNLRNAIERLDERLAEKRRKKKRRLATRPTGASKKRRLAGKSQRQTIKKGRRKPSIDE